MSGAIMLLKITNAKIVADKIENKDIYIKDGLIYAVTDEPIPCDEIIDAEGLYISAGFIDTHVHGGGGADFTDGDEKCVETAIKAHLKHGTTTIIPTTVADSFEAIDECIGFIKNVAEKNTEGANIFGVHLEGPYIAMSQKGAINPKYIKNPDKAEYEALISKYDGFIKKITFAPELKGAKELCTYLKEKNVIASAGHTEATIDHIRICREEGLNMFTHLFSAMSTITRKDGYRILGAIESAYYFDDMYTEVIADGCHLPPELLKIIYKIKGADRICLITDAMRGADMPEGPSVLGSLKNNFECFIEDGIAKMPDKSCFAGSVATCDRLVRVMTKQVGISLPEAVKMMTKTPAVAHGIENKGQIKEGYDADLVFFDEDINIKKVIIKKNNEIKITGENL